MKNLKPEKGKDSKNESGYVLRVCLNVMFLRKILKCAHNVSWYMRRWQPQKTCAHVKNFTKTSGNIFKRFLKNNKAYAQNYKGNDNKDNSNMKHAENSKGHNNNKTPQY